PLAVGPVADLVVVLRVPEEPVPREVTHRATVAALPEARMLPVVDEDAFETARDVGPAGEVGEEAVPFAGERRVQRVVEVVAPRRVQPVAAPVDIGDEPR